MTLASLLTPTFNRRAWIPQLVRCVLGQTWLRDRAAEWIILDDGTDPIEDLLPEAGSLPRGLEIRYVRLEERLPLGEKRNRLHALARGDVAVYMDDDDYHFPDRVLHSVQALARNPRAMAAGCSELPVWFLPENSLCVFGPFAKTHATCGTLAVRRELYTRRSFEPSALQAEESAFLDEWRVPLVQLDPWRVILCVAHARNTVEKRAVRERLLGGSAHLVRACAASPVKLVVGAESRRFYMEMINSQASSSASPSAGSCRKGSDSPS